MTWAWIEPPVYCFRLYYELCHNCVSQVTHKKNSGMLYFIVLYYVASIRVSVFPYRVNNSFFHSSWCTYSRVSSNDSSSSAKLCHSSSQSWQSDVLGWVWNGLKTKDDCGLLFCHFSIFLESSKVLFALPSWFLMWDEMLYHVLGAFSLSLCSRSC